MDELENLVKKYEANFKVATQEFWPTQYDDLSARFNYAIIREYKPKVVVEYGAYKGRCTHDILKALIDNGKSFIFKSYEISDEDRKDAQKMIDEIFGKKAIKIGGDVTKAKDLPKNIDYLFLDHSHQELLSKWTLEQMIPRVKRGGIIMIHDVPLKENYIVAGGHHIFPETQQLLEMHKAGTLPFEKKYWLYDEYATETTWWTKI